LEHFQEKWNPVFRPKMQPRKMLERLPSPVFVNPLYRKMEQSLGPLPDPDAEGGWRG
jgi:hypothetical protein